MTLKLGSLNKPRQSFGSGNSGSENVAVMIAEVHVHDKARKAANPAEDYAIAYLLEDGFGKKAEFNDKVAQDHPEYMSPLTSVKIKMRTDVKVSGEFTQPGVFDLQVGKRKGAGMPMGEFPTIVLESAYLDSRTDTVMARWYRVGQRDFNNRVERCLTDVLVSVDAERYDMRENERVYYQSRYAMMNKDARSFAGLESFKATAASFLTENPEAAGGRPAVTVRIIDNAVAATGKLTENTIATANIYPGWDKAAEARLTPEQSVDNWLANPENAGWVEYIEASGTDEAKGYTFELIPSFRYTTGRDSLPSKKGKGIDDAENFRIPLEDRAKGGAHVAKQNGDGFLMTSGFAAGSMIVKRANDTDAPWFSTNTFRKSRFGAIYMRDEVLTPNLPEDVRKAFSQAAEARGNAARQTFTGNSRDAEQSSSHDEEIPFGEPDHSGGLTPS